MTFFNSAARWTPPGKRNKYVKPQRKPWQRPRVPLELRKPTGPKPRIPDCHPESRHEAHGKCRDCVRREERWRTRLGIDFTVDDYEARLAEQAGVCAICLNPPYEQRLAVDHDHTTKQVRGLLCYACNRLLLPLLQYHVTPERLERAAQYLRRSAHVDCSPQSHTSESPAHTR